MFIDASALVAVLTGEPERDKFVEALQSADHPSTSAIAVYEASHAVSRKTGAGLKKSCELVVRFAEELKIQIQPIMREDALMAVDASSQYGKGSGHPAQLNMGDCFSYAMAKRAGVRLLYKGDDFARTDLG